MLARHTFELLHEPNLKSGTVRIGFLDQTNLDAENDLATLLRPLTTHNC